MIIFYFNDNDNISAKFNPCVLNLINHSAINIHEYHFIHSEGCQDKCCRIPGAIAFIS